MTGEVTITNHNKIGGGNPLVLIAGPCVIESEDLTLEIVESLIEITKSLNIPLIFIIHLIIKIKILLLTGFYLFDY